MAYKLPSIWGELCYQLEEIADWIHLKTFFASLPVAYTAHFLGDWHLLELWFGVACVDLFMGIQLARKAKIFSWDKISAWTFKILVHGTTIIVVGILAHVASIALKYDVLILNIYMAILIAKELGSVVRNASVLNWPIPNVLVTIITAIDTNAEKKIVEVTHELFNADGQANTTNTQKQGEPDDLHSR